MFTIVPTFIQDWVICCTGDFLERNRTRFLSKLISMYNFKSVLKILIWNQLDDTIYHMKYLLHFYSHYDIANVGS